MGGWAANLGAGLGSFASDVALMGVQSAFNQQAAGMAWDRQKNLMTRGPTYAMQGLREAGLNPILAASGGIKGAGNAPQQSATAISSSGSQRALLGSQLELTKEQTRAAEAQGTKTQAEAMIQGAIANVYQDPEVQNAMKEAEKNKAIPDTPTQVIYKSLIKEAQGMSGNAKFTETPEIEALIDYFKRASDWFKPEAFGYGDKYDRDKYLDVPSKERK